VFSATLSPGGLVETRAMCCFSGNVTFVRGTRVFARITEPGRQAIVYQMEFGAKQDLAMILPLPVAAGADEKAVKFIDLSGYKTFFFPHRPHPRRQDKE
jgi:hypothetical protein